MEDSCPMDVKFVKLNFEKNHKGIVDELYYTQQRIFLFWFMYLDIIDVE